jgi:hypothetical protein
VFEGIRAVVAGHPPALSLLAAGVALSLAYLAAACATFAGVYRYALHRGLIARYSAESAA